MARSVAQLNAEIYKLQRQADVLKTKEMQGVIARIREAISQYDLTAADLGLDGVGATKRRAGAKTAGKKPTKGLPKGKKSNVVKYANAAGDTWGGRGRRPLWFTAALEAGATEESLLVRPEA